MCFDSRHADIQRASCAGEDPDVSSLQKRYSVSVHTAF